MGQSFKTGAKIYVMNDNIKWYPKWLIDSNLKVTNTFNDMESFGINMFKYLGEESRSMINMNKKFIIEFTKQ